MLFEAGFSENTQTLHRPSTWKELLKADLADALGGDELKPGSSKKSCEEMDGTGIAYIVVKDESPENYRTILTWLDTKAVVFATQRDEDAPNTPQAIYALAHKLDINELQSIALKEYTSRLTSANCMRELLSNHAFLYPKLKQAAMKAVIDNWALMKALGRKPSAQDLVKAGGRDLEQLAEILTELLGKL